MSKLIARIASAAAIALAAIPVVAATAAHAETPASRILSTRVVVRDIDFSRADHVAVFDQRVARAAFKICPVETRQNSAKAEACRLDLRNQAIAQLGDNQRARLAQGAGFALAAK